MSGLSLVVTTRDNADTLERCLASCTCADERVVLDSGSRDATREIAASFGARVESRPFAGYGAQKQAAIDLAANDWVLLLDADEALSPEADRWLAERKAAGFEGVAYELPRREQIFWRMQSPATRPDYHLRLFDRRQTRMSTMPVHAAPKTDGRVTRVKVPFHHFGEPDIHTKVEKINAYSSGLVAHKRARGRKGHPLMLVFYPAFVFLRLYVFKRQFMNGWAGFINARVGAFYAFIKYAKVYEARRRERQDADTRGQDGE